MQSTTMQSTTTQSHNLNIHMYTLDDILALFDLTHTITLDDLKRAKKKVLMLHPDKSRLGSEYFLFYKKAFDLVVQFSDNQNKQNQQVSEENTQYSINDPKHTSINKVISNMPKEKFQEKFNQLFEKNMQKEAKPNVNDWFSHNDPLYQMDENAGKNMGKALEQIKQQSNSMNVYRGVQTLSSGPRNGNLYDDDASDMSEYVSSDPFSKLKYDDLRKVHKDQTVFAVSEQDFDKIQKYGSVDQLNQARGHQNLTPLDKVEAQRILEGQENQLKQQIWKKEHLAKLETMKYQEKNKSVMSAFMFLGN